ncbi:sphingosine-1-phosphate lyase 1 [Strongylocentrotus purpuratus]|uniref:sphinganine-1-phosphate aldolase n=1 Tax=Strongylocentrotus purpuratus TaxID=7668 RepID=A0A7M7TGT6_STRPU|nr:sphingosine-1-phosphate lyase 1 [Strongylocentrotus purpuratus]|eukprot:XP_790556.2 PREDICTED: sphingosine-1-phosphate lyase 1 [Strongylocentrotus purpuratus]
MDEYKEIALLYADETRRKVNELCSGLEAWQIIAYSVGVTLLLNWLYNFLCHPRLTIKQRIVQNFFKFVKSLPIIKDKIKAEIDKNVSDIARDLFPLKPGDSYITELPAKGLTRENILNKVNKDYKPMGGIDWKGGKVSGCVYAGTDELAALAATMYEDFAWTNPLHPDVFPDVRKMEAEIVAMTLKMFNASKSGCGTMTSGGTESILMALASYRDLATERGIEYPEIIAPVSAHAAFDKAAHYFRMKLVHVPLDPVTQQADVRAMRRKINKRTAVLVGSAPMFPFGVMDPIEKIAELGDYYNIPVHVDSCLGGFLVPFMEKAGFPLAPFDFRVKGVTSISADTHKYGYAPKGSSVIMYSEKKFRHPQFFVSPDWTGGIYATPTIGGSRAGAIIAACWATMMYFGEDGYVENTRKIVSTTRKVAEEVGKIPGLFVYGNPEVSVVGVGSKVFNIYRLSGALTERGWNLNSLQFPSSFHLCVTLRQTFPGVAEQFIQDVKECTEEIMKTPNEKASGSAALYGTAQAIPDRSLVTDMARGYLDAYYSTDPIE